MRTKSFGSAWTPVEHLFSRFQNSENVEVLVRELSFRRFENSRNVEVPAGNNTNTFVPDKYHGHGSSPVTITSFSVHGHEPRTRFLSFILYPLKNSLPAIGHIAKMPQIS
jgi:hypothetical protein